MSTTLSTTDLAALVGPLTDANRRHAAAYPGDPTTRQPVHTVYGGANLFKAGVHLKLGQLALKALDEYAPDFVTFARAIGLEGAEQLPTEPARVAALAAELGRDPERLRVAYEPAWRAFTVYGRVRDKLAREPIEEQRIDFEDGYGNRPDAEEDGHAVQAATELARAVTDGLLPPFLGFRIKPLTEESRARSVRTLDLFLTTLAAQAGGRLPQGFVVTLPKVTHPEQVATLARLLDALEGRTGLPKGGVGIDLMIETTQSILDEAGRSNVALLVRAGAGRVRSCAFGTYDYTASCNITAAHQRHTHAACDFARHVLQVSLAGTGVTASDGATTVMPIGPHKATPEKPLTAQQVAENRAVVHSAWALHFANVQHSLAHAYYQGWDLNPAQLPIRYAAIYDFFLRGLHDASTRLNAFVQKAAQATLVGNTFDDAATGQGLLNFFLRGLACGALTEAEVLATGITLDELKGRSFLTIVANRASKA
jgi:hypothetical protein